MSDCKTSHDTARQFIKNGKTKTNTFFSRLMFYVVKRSNISAHNAFIRVESRAGCHKERGGIHSFNIPCFVTVGLWRSSSFVKRGLRKVHHGNRGIWWQEAFCEVARAHIKHPIMQSSQQLLLWNKTHNSMWSSYLNWDVTSLSQFSEPWDVSDTVN